MTSYEFRVQCDTCGNECVIVMVPDEHGNLTMQSRHPEGALRFLSARMITEPEEEG